MIRRVQIASCLIFAIAIAVIAVPGCRDPKATSAKGEKGKAKEKEHAHEDHGHPEAGPHGGPLAEWGEDKYHGELVIDHAAKHATVYILDGKAKKAPEIAADKITDVKISVVGAKPEVVVHLKHDPKKSDDKGIAFVGTDEVFAKEADAKFNINWKVDGKADGSDVTYTPKKTKTAISLTPGGKYTEADIKANGGMTPREKYAKLKHVAEEPKVGEKICPYSKEKANPECTWVIQGQKYEFCCPPCIDSFLKIAQNDPGKVKDAEDYVFKK